MTNIRLKALAVLVATTLAGAAFAQTSTSPSPGSTATPGSNEPSSPSVTPGGPTTAPPLSTSPSSPSDSSSSTTPSTPTSPSSPSMSGPSTSQGSTMGRGADEALATPEDRAKCAALSGTAQADCIADARRQREADDRMRTSRDTTQPPSTTTR